MSELKVIDAGRMDYESAIELQMRLHERVRCAESDTVYCVLVEHDPPVITTGRRADFNNIIASPDILKRAGVTVYESSRGGDVTYHGPGQLVGYPIIRLDTRGRNVHKYLRDLEETIIRLLGRYGLSAGRKEGLTGVWVGTQKICAMGIAVKRWVSCHGFAINITTDMSHFDFIVPCGIRDKGVTSLEKLLDAPVSVDEVKKPLIECMCEVFGFEDVKWFKLGELENEL